MKTRKVPFDIYLPATEHRAAVKVDTIRIEVYTDDFGSEMVTPASTQLIEKTQARYMGLLAAEDIRALRERHGLSQDQLSDLLGCGKKSLSRWENGREYPSQLVNTLLRLLADDVITPDDLRAVRQPLAPPPTKSKKSRTGPIPVQNPTRSIRRKIQKTGLGIRSPRRSHSLSNLPLQETPVT
jgi:DNA-binding transcriptional regulator YiaG